MTKANAKLSLYLVCVSLIALTMLAYWPILDSGFVGYDDDLYVAGNSLVQSGLTARNVASAFTTTQTANWHPLTWISHMGDVTLYRLNPIGHHLTNLLLHLANVLLLFALIRLMTGSTWRSGFVAGLFAVHPLHVESVAWISERKDVLSTLFWMLTMLAYVRYVRSRDRGRPLRSRVGAYVIVVALYALGLMAKPMLVTLPIVLMLMDWWPLGRYGKRDVPTSPDPSFARRGEGKGTSPQPVSRCSMSEVRGPKGEGKGTSPTSRTHRTAMKPSPGRRGSHFPDPHPPIPVPRHPSPVPRHPSPVICHLFEKLPLLALAAASCVVTFVAQRAGGAVGTVEVYPVGARIANALVSYVSYLGKMLWPRDLSVYYPHPGNALPAWQVIGSGLLLAAISIVVARLGRSRPYVMVGWLWYVVTLLPVIGLVQVGSQAMADRYTYIPLIGIFIMAAWALPHGPHRAGRTSIALGVAVLVALTICGRVQVGYWRNGVTLFEHALASSPPNHVSEMNLAVCLDRQGRFDEAMIHFREALRMRPTSPEVHYNMAVTLRHLGLLDEAISHYRQALRRCPRYLEARYNLGLTLDEKGMPRAAIRNYEQALRIAPDCVQARNNLAVALYSVGDYARAWKEVRRARQYGYEPHPDFIEALRQRMPEPASEDQQ